MKIGIRYDHGVLVLSKPLSGGWLINPIVSVNVNNGIITVRGRFVKCVYYMDWEYYFDTPDWWNRVDEALTPKKYVSHKYGFFGTKERFLPKGKVYQLLPEPETTFTSNTWRIEGNIPYSTTSLFG